MWESIQRVVAEFWGILTEMSPYLLFGFLVAGILSVLVKPETVERHLGGHGIWPIVKASAFGVPLPLCSCGVIPVAASLRRHGASRGSTTSFLISTPQTGVDSILVTFSLLGPVVAIFRPIAAFLSGVFGGSIVSLTQKNDSSAVAVEDKCQDACCAPKGTTNKLIRILQYGFVTLPRDIAKSLIVGLAIAGLIAVLVPEGAFSGRLGQGITGMLVMMLLGIPIYVCATASVPIAAALIAKGVSPGAAIVFLMTGPATNAAAIATIWKVLGRRTVFVYVGVVAVCALASGFALNSIIETTGMGSHMAGHEMLPAFVSISAAIVLLSVLFFSLYAPGHKPKEGENHETEGKGGTMESKTLRVTGMTCSHCANAVKRAITEASGVVSADVDLSTGIAKVSGEGFDVSVIMSSIEQLGYKAEVTEG